MVVVWLIRYSFVELCGYVLEECFNSGIPSIFFPLHVGQFATWLISWFILGAKNEGKDQLITRKFGTDKSKKGNCWLVEINSFLDDLQWFCDLTFFCLHFVLLMLRAFGEMLVFYPTVSVITNRKPSGSRFRIFYICRMV